MKITFFVFMLSLTYLQAEEEVNFRRDIRPILSDRCFHCHGPDEETREGHIRFDIPDGKEGAFRVRKKRAAIVPGKPQKSHLYLRLITDDDDDVMPPLDSHKVALTVKEKENFKKWIEQGAKWSGHWAFEAPVKPAVPALKKTQWARNTIDAFIMKRLEKEGLGVSPEAPRYKLIRRLSYDLTGLPPTPQEVRNFIKDKSAKAYEKVVDKFLAKPSYGERMALPWLDMARYGDSSVYHADGPRTMWPWRDWVIKAYNDNKPFDEFTLEQIGGDHIKKRTDDQHLATAFLRNNGTTDEGGAFFEEYRVEYTVDRLATVSKVWLGLTTECAQCHDHKYDPISQKEFFQMYAFFNVAADPGKQSRKGNQAPILSLPLPQPQLDLLAKLQKQISAIEKTQEHHKKLNKQLFAKWTKQQTRGRIKAPGFTKYLRHYFPLNSTQNLSDYIEASKLTYQGKSHKIQQKADRFGETRDKSKKDQVGKSIYFNGQKTVHGQKTSWIDTTTPFSISVWVKHFKSKSPQVLISKLDNHKKGSGRGYELLIKDDKVCFSLNSDRAKNILHIESIKTLEAQKWHYITVTYDARKKAAGLKVYINAQPAKTKILKDSLKGSVTNKAQLIIGGRGKDRFMGWVNHLQIYDIALTRKDIVRSAKAGFGEFLFQGFSGENTRLFAKIKDHYFDSLDKNFMALNQKKKKVNDQLNIAKRFKLNVMVMEDQKKPRKTYILDRGAYDSPQKEQIHPSTPAALPPMKKEYPKNRLGFAKWIMDKDNPLTARVTVNRYWMMFFGRGLVDTPADFGNQGSWPTHPELLDWLAVDFREHGWNVKRTLKQILMSKTYRQDSNFTKKLLAVDPENKLYARGPRFRLSGEHIRDTALYVSGLLNPKIGGESVKPYQPKGLWAELSLSGANFVQDKGDKNYRKSIYTYYKRSAPIPNMVTFDAPSREKCTIQRSRTNSPLQALITLNDPIFVEAARFFAERVMRQGGASIKSKINFAFANALARKPAAYTGQLIIKLYEKTLSDFAKNPKKSKQLLNVGDKQRDKSLNLAEHAAWTVIAQLILNLDETLNKE